MACMQTAYRIEMISGKVEKRKEKMIGNGFESKNITKRKIFQSEHDRDACSQQFFIITTQISPRDPGNKIHKFVSKYLIKNSF